MLTSDGTYRNVIVGQHYSWPVYDYAEGRGINATFSEISFFIQRNDTEVLIADKNNGCIRQLDRLTNITELFAGVCEKLRGYSDIVRDGNRLNATFRRINSLFLYKSTLFILESNAQRIRKLDLVSDEVSTVVTSENFTLSHHLPQTMVADSITGLMYVTTTYGLAVYNPTSDTFRYMVSYQQKGYQDGSLDASRWYYNNGMVYLPNNTLIIADINNGHLRIVNLKSENVTTWCFYNPKTLQNCTITKPMALAIIGCSLYVSTYQRISTIQIPESYCRSQITEDQMQWTSKLKNWVSNNNGETIGL